MARELLAGGGGRNAWRALKQALVAPRHYPNAGQKKIGSPQSTFKAEMMSTVARDSSSSTAAAPGAGGGGGGGGWRDLIAKSTTNIGRNRGSNNCSEGLSSLLLSPRADATMVQRSAILVGRRCTQLISPQSGAASSKTSMTFPGWTQKVYGSSSSTSISIAGRSSSISSLLKGQMEQSQLMSLMTRSGAAARRNLSSSSGTGTWAEQWKKLRDGTERLFKGGKTSPKLQQPKAGGAASVGLQKFVSRGGRDILSEVTSPLRRTFSHYREAVVLQIEAFWKRNYLVIVGLLGLGVCFLLWRLMFGVASTFISMSEGLAKFGFLALAAAMVILGGVIMRARFTINPDSVYRIAMRKLNASAGVLEVMGAPLSGSDLRAYIMSGGGLRMKKFKPRLAGKRCFIIFPIQGADRRGLVTIEVKKKKGKYNFKLLAVDVPTAGADQRLYLIGDEEEYKVGDGLIHVLRDPLIKAMAAQKEFEDLDMKEEEDEDRKAMEAEKLRAQEELDRLAEEQEAREQDELKLLKDESVAVDETQTPPEHQGKDEKPIRAQVG